MTRNGPVARHDAARRAQANNRTERQQLDEKRRELQRQLDAAATLHAHSDSTERDQLESQMLTLGAKVRAHDREIVKLDAELPRLEEELRAADRDASGVHLDTEASAAVNIGAPLDTEITTTLAALRPRLEAFEGAVGRVEEAAEQFARCHGSRHFVGARVESLVADKVDRVLTSGARNRIRALLILARAGVISL